MSDLEMKLDREHPDGTRPLIVRTATDVDLEPAIATEPVDCYMAKFTEQLGQPYQPGCSKVIEPGRHYLRHVLHGHDTTVEPMTSSYCAACAIRECRWWHVEEVPAA